MTDATAAGRKPLIAGNWKMHLDHLEAIRLVQQLAYHLQPEDYEQAEIAVLPAFTGLRSVQTLIEGDRLPMSLGAQDVHWEEEGAFTGAVSVPMLRKLNVTYVLCGHSERRSLFGDDDTVVKAKLDAVLRGGLTPILCVGETLEQRESGEAETVVAGQLRAALSHLPTADAQRVVVAYKPVWAIGTGRTASPDDADAMCGFVRGTVGEISGKATADALRVQYGGSVKPGNVGDLMRRTEIDGALVGGASLDADDFAIICRYHRL